REKQEFVTSRLLRIDPNLQNHEKQLWCILEGFSTTAKPKHALSVLHRDRSFWTTLSTTNATFNLAIPIYTMERLLRLGGRKLNVMMQDLC
ncbi:hypothetical protein M8C21_006525, partial [Ambrosia artemisiifolia]